jgi:hypothetical protein
MVRENTDQFVSLNDIQRVQRQIVDLREQLRRCVTRLDANRNAGHLLDNTMRDSLRLARAIAKCQARLEQLHSRRSAALNNNPALPIA